jgi:hypothetical protein
MLNIQPHRSGSFWTSRVNLLIAIMAACLLLGGCSRAPADSNTGSSGAGGPKRYRFEVRTFQPVDPAMKPVKQVYFNSDKGPLSVSWEGAPDTSYGAEHPERNFMAVPVGPKPDKRPWSFAVNGLRFSLTQDGLEGAGQTWVLKDGETTEIDVDQLNAPAG